MKLFRFSLILLFFVSPSLAFAAEKIYVVAKDVSLFDSDSLSFGDQALNDALIAVGGGENTNEKTITLKKDLRDKVLKTLKISETDFVFFKALNTLKTYTYKISEVSVGIEVNWAGEGSISDVVLILPAKEIYGVASVGSNNPFNDTGKLQVFKIDKGAYQITPEIKLLEKSGKMDGHLRVGRWEFSLQIGEKILPLKSYDLESGHYVSDVDILGGNIFADGSSLIYVTGYGSCGFFAQVKDKKAEVTEPSCGVQGC